MKQAMRDWMLAAICSAIVLASVVLAWSYLLHLRPVMDYGTNTRITPAIVFPGDAVQLCRDMMVKREATLTIARAMVRTTQAGVDTVFFDTIRVHRQPGELKQCRHITLPADLQAGEWEMRTDVSHEDWPFWSATEQAPPVRLRVLEEDSNAY